MADQRKSPGTPCGTGKTPAGDARGEASGAGRARQPEGAYRVSLVAALLPWEVRERLAPAGAEPGRPSGAGVRVGQGREGPVLLIPGFRAGDALD